MAEPRLTPEEKLNQLRDALKDAITLAERLLPFCPTTEEMLSVLTPALDNDAQLKILLSLIESPKR